MWKMCLVKSGITIHTNRETINLWILLTGLHFGIATIYCSSIPPWMEHSFTPMEKILSLDLAHNMQFRAAPWMWEEEFTQVISLRLLHPNHFVLDESVWLSKEVTMSLQGKVQRGTGITEILQRYDRFVTLCNALFVGRFPIMPVPPRATALESLELQSESMKWVSWSGDQVHLPLI